MKARLLLRFARRKANLLFTRHLLATNCAICSVSSCIGDLISQRLEGVKPHRWGRTAAVSSVGLLLGPTSHYWYLFLDKHFAGRSARALTLKVVFDTVFFSPMYIAMYVVALGLLRGSNMQEMRKDLIESGFAIYQYEATVWTVAQVANFYFLPTRFRVSFDNLVSLAFDTLYSYRLNHDKD